MDPHTAMAALDDALDQVARLQEHVGQALLPGAGPAAVQHLQASQHSVGRLQQLSAQLQRLAAAVQQAAPPASSQQQQPTDEQAAWAAGLQEQAKHAAEALQQHVTAAVGAPGRQLMMCAAAGADVQRQAAGHHSPTHILWELLHRMGTAAPGLQLHMFRSSTGRLLCSYDARRGPFDASRQHPERPGLDAASVSQVSAFVEEVRVVCPGVFVAAIALAAPGRLQPVRVCVDSADRASAVDPWTNSKHQVFKRISQLATRALLHFQHLEAAHALLLAPASAPDPAAAAARSPADSTSSSTTGTTGSSSGGAGAADGTALEALLLWLACFDDLFLRPCDVSGRVVMWAPGTAVPLPPYVRPYWLSLEGLREAAGNKSLRKAYHAHLAPWPQPDAPPQPPQQQATTRPPAAAAHGDGGGGSAAGAGPDSVTGGAGLLAASGSAGQPQWAASAAVSEVTDEQLREQLRRVIGPVF